MKEGQTKRLREWGAAVLVLLCILGTVVFFRSVIVEEASAPGLMRRWVISVMRSIYHESFGNPVIIGALAFTLILERLIPVDRKQKLFSLNFFQDLVWWAYTIFVEVAVITMFATMLRQAYHTYISASALFSVTDFSFWWRFIFGILLVDFLFWLQHFFHHKVPWFWDLHTVHHSQKQLNFFTDFRYHSFEYLLRVVGLTIPFLILEVSTPTIVLFSIFRRQYSHFYHGNIKTNLGVLRYILVTPQSHRIHHSILPQHWDKNYGAIFSIWDFMFGTQYMGFDEYPETGIADDNFPHEEKSNPAFLLLMPLIQIFYSLRLIGRSISRHFAKPGNNNDDLP